MKRKILLAVTGASGSIYTMEFLNLVRDLPVEIHGIISEAGEKVLALELASRKENLPGISRWYDFHDFAAPAASGSADYDAMAVVPCTMGTLAAIAHGLSQNLIHRAADVMLKERKPLILVVRETPFNRNHLQNMLAAHDSGATICPAMPAFYLKPQNLTEMARDFSCRLADQLGIAIPGRKRWVEQVSDE